MNQDSIKSALGKYQIHRDARPSLRAYFDETVPAKFSDVAQHIFPIVDKNKDYIIDEEEADDALDMIRPHVTKFYEGLMATSKEKTEEENLNAKVQAQ